MIFLKSPQEISIMREGGRILRQIMEEIKKEVKPGILTEGLEKKASELILKKGAKPSFLNFEGYPAVLCTSVNEEIVHVVPSKRELKEGDIISLDLGIFYKRFHSDMAITLPVGEISDEARRLIRITKKALKLAIKKAKAGNTLGDIGNTIQKYVESQDFNVIRDLCGHGIGKKLHEPPQVLNFGKSGSGQTIKEGMVFCIEPMVSAGNYKIKKSSDGFGYETEDNSLSCHFEHTVAVTKKEAIILTE